jgi:hypothetical protein
MAPHRIFAVAILAGLVALALIKAAPPDLQRTIWRAYFAIGLGMSCSLLLHALILRGRPLRDFATAAAWRELVLAGLFWPYALLALLLPRPSNDDGTRP